MTDAQLEKAAKAIRQRDGDALEYIASKEIRSQVRKLARTKAELVMEQIEKSAVKAIKNVDTLIDSTNEDISLRASTYTIDHLIGKATQKTFSRVERINIDILAD